MDNTGLMVNQYSANSNLTNRDFVLVLVTVVVAKLFVYRLKPQG